MLYPSQAQAEQNLGGQPAPVNCSERWAQRRTSDSHHHSVMMTHPQPEPRRIRCPKRLRKLVALGNLSPAATLVLARLPTAGLQHFESTPSSPRQHRANSSPAPGGCETSAQEQATVDASIIITTAAGMATTSPHQQPCSSPGPLAEARRMHMLRRSTSAQPAFSTPAADATAAPKHHDAHLRSSVLYEGTDSNQAEGRRLVASSSVGGRGRAALSARSAATTATSSRGWGSCPDRRLSPAPSGAAATRYDKTGSAPLPMSLQAGSVDDNGVQRPCGCRSAQQLTMVDSNSIMHWNLSEDSTPFPPGDQCMWSVPSFQADTNAMQTADMVVDVLVTSSQLLSTRSDDGARLRVSSHKGSSSVCEIIPDSSEVSTIGTAMTFTSTGGTAAAAGGAEGLPGAGISPRVPSCGFLFLLRRLTGKLGR